MSWVGMCNDAQIDQLLPERWTEVWLWSFSAEVLATRALNSQLVCLPEWALVHDY